MSEPVLELIAQAVKGQAETIITTNGYATDVGTVIRRVRRGDRLLADEQIVLAQGERRKPADGEAGGITEWVQPFLLMLVLRPGEEEATPVDQLVNRFVADVEKCFTEAGGRQDWYISGMVQHTVRGPTALPEELADAAGAVMTVEVHYRTAEGDPFTAG